MGTELKCFPFLERKDLSFISAGDIEKDKKYFFSTMEQMNYGIRAITLSCGNWLSMISADCILLTGL